ncbi:MAG: hypothetical protein WC788_06315 [Candidatus Paceibacterota bacterium]|jgi:hypothetical protein
MKTITAYLMLFLVVSLSIPMVLAQENTVPRGKYIYDERGTLSIQDTLFLSSSLWKLDAKTGYQTVYVFPKDNLTEREMAKWFNDHGVGNAKTETGLAFFIFPDNSVFGMIGRKHDRIGTPYLSYFSARSLAGIENDRTRALNNLTFDLKKELGVSATYERAYNTGKAVADNFHIIMGWAFMISLFVLLYKQKDGYQSSDLVLPAIILVLTLFAVGIMSLGSNDSLPSYTKEFGITTSTKLKDHEYTERHCSGSGDDEICWWDRHTEYFNYVTITSYDFKVYNYRFYSKDNKWAWERKEGELLGLDVYIQGNSVSSVELPVRDNSGGRTEYMGTWIKTTNVTKK